MPTTTPPAEPPVELRKLIESREVEAPDEQAPDELEPQLEKRLGPLAVASAFEITPG